MDSQEPYAAESSESKDPISTGEPKEIFITETKCTLKAASSNIANTKASDTQAKQCKYYENDQVECQHLCQVSEVY